METFNLIGFKFQSIKEKLETSKTAYNELTKEIVDLTEQVKTYKEAISLAKKVIERNIEHKKFFESMISEGLTEVKGVKYEYKLEEVFDKFGNLKGVDPLVRRNGGKWRDPSSAEGAGVQSMISFLTIICILLIVSRMRKTKRVLIADEPFKTLAPSLQERLKEFLIKVCDSTGLQLIMTTHLDQPFGKVYKISMKDEISYAEVLE